MFVVHQMLNHFAPDEIVKGRRGIGLARANEPQPFSLRKAALLRDVVTVSFSDPRGQEERALQPERMADEAVGHLVRDDG